MLKLSFVGAAAAVTLQANLFDLDAIGVSVADKFAAFKSQFAKVYASPEAERRAFSAFAANEQIILQHNARKLSYWLGHNQFSDMSWEQFKAAGYVGRVQESNRTKNYVRLLP